MQGFWQSGRRRQQLSVLAGLVLLLASLGSQAQAPASISASASISGTVTDTDGDVVPTAVLSLSSATAATRQVSADEDGDFRFDAVVPGIYTLRVLADGFAERLLPITVHAGEFVTVPTIALVPASVNQQVDAIGQKELAQIQLHQEEKQRIFGIVPNFYVAYDPNTVPLTAGQKFQLARKTVLDPVVFLSTAISAGVDQGTQTPVEWPQTFAGYWERYGADYAGALAGIELSGAVFPAVFHQDPRYFYKGTGGWKARTSWALKQVVEQKSDHGRWQPAYSNTLGDISSSLVTTAIYPHQSTSWGKTIGVDFGLNVASEAFGNLMEEFVVPKLKWGHKKQP